MMYISKGVAKPSKDPSMFYVSHCGTVFALGKELAALWRNARILPRPVPVGRERAVLHLMEAGLASTTDEEGDIAQYRLLNDCILSPVDADVPLHILRSRDRRIWTWLTKAGLRLTISELVRLEEQHLRPTPALLGEGGRQELTCAIYCPENICDGLLQVQMEHSAARSATVGAVLRLLRMGRLALL